MQVKFATSGKRINSTSIPTFAAADTFTCVLKRPCSVENPILDLSVFEPRYSVAYIPDFHRYYFVSNIESISNSITRYYLTVDVLASFKARILANTVFVTRSQSNGTGLLVDPYATHTASNPNIYNVSTAIDKYSTTGFYVLQTVGRGTDSSIGEGVNTYLITSTELRKLVDQIFLADMYDENGNTTVGAAEKTYFNPFQYIVSCRWFPLATNAVTASTDKYIKFGWWTTAAVVDSGGTHIGAVGKLIQDETVFSYTDFSLPSLVDWTASSPDYSRYTLFVPGVGAMEIDPAFAGLPLYAKIIVDLATGGCRCEIRYDDATPTHGTANPILSVANGYWGVDILLTQLASDATNIASTAINSATNAMYGMGALDTFAASTSAGPGSASALAQSVGILESIPFVGSSFKRARENLMQPALSMNGAMGNFSELQNYPYLKLTVKHYDVLEPNMATTNGLPYNRNVLLSNLTGYTQCNNASVTVQSATMKEKLAIKSYLEGGFWIE